MAQYTTHYLGPCMSCAGALFSRATRDRGLRKGRDFWLLQTLNPKSLSPIILYTPKLKVYGFRGLDFQGLEVYLGFRALGLGYPPKPIPLNPKKVLALQAPAKDLGLWAQGWQVEALGWRAWTSTYYCLSGFLISVLFLNLRKIIVCPCLPRSPSLLF